MGLSQLVDDVGGSHGGGGGGTSDRIVHASPQQSLEKTQWSRSSPQTCHGCGSLKGGGWVAPNGDYFCSACWDHWFSIPVAPAEAGRGSTRAKTDTRTSSKRTKVILCNLMGNGCGCCVPPNPADAAGIDDDGDSWRSLFYEPDLPELCGLKYSDAHCHLDDVLQNNKHGGPGWDSKQKLCKYWLEGDCSFDYCDFAHGEHELQTRIPLGREDIEPYLQHYIGKRSVGNTKRAMSGDTSTEGPILDCLITNCCELRAVEDTKLILEVADQVCPGTVFCSFGCHPHDYRDYSDDMEARLLAALDACGPRVVAWGECGLDYCKNYYESSRPADRRQMLDVFARQARVAVARKLPLIVHSRDAESDTMQVLKECLPRDHKFHVHAYQGKLNMMMEALDWFPNCIFGTSGLIMLAYPSEGAVEAARHCPLERLVLETDAPYLSNGSNDIPKVAKQVAQLKGLSAAEVMETTSLVCQRFYGVRRS